MPDNWLASRGRVLAGLVEAVSLYGAACLSCGGLAVFASHAANALVWFSGGVHAADRPAVPLPRFGPGPAEETHPVEAVAG